MRKTTSETRHAEGILATAACGRVKRCYDSELGYRQKCSVREHLVSELLRIRCEVSSLFFLPQFQRFNRDQPSRISPKNDLRRWFASLKASGVVSLAHLASFAIEQNMLELG